MIPTLTTPARIPFHYGLFYHAMIGLIGRDPDLRVRQGFDGFYDFIYKPKDDVERKKFPEVAATLRQWLDTFDITFSGSHCNVTKEWDNGTEEVLQVTITHPVTAENIVK